MLAWSDKINEEPKDASNDEVSFMTYVMYDYIFSYNAIA